VREPKAPDAGAKARVDRMHGQPVISRGVGFLDDHARAEQGGRREDVRSAASSVEDCRRTPKDAQPSRRVARVRTTSRAHQR
jgi:hypothetical protein